MKRITLLYDTLLDFVFLFEVFTSSTTEMKKQNRKLARTICSLVDQSTLDDKVVEKLSCFSSELSELEIVLTACDIIPLNRSLLGIVSKIQFLIHPIEYAPVSFYIMLLSRQRVL
ncbi:uncharacterized protein LOC123265604 isoform X1 [Cotesia glomerata]|uniref:uncharacterized protein LOC123265604 isoform X1 n=1 Tax=Cotesia glomerata TaxID=32391 RepID=UPI001D0189B6|nr:uncharacterized protein LOC123265604 isoform X1 [Cotesia glomerata]